MMHTNSPLHPTSFALRKKNCDAIFRAIFAEINLSLFRCRRNNSLTFHYVRTPLLQCLGNSQFSYGWKQNTSTGRIKKLIIMIYINEC
jgi:hypothetical protein